ncbi:MAG: arginine--tRNA ligase, partial [Myxococcota bacterium]
MRIERWLDAEASQAMMAALATEAPPVVRPTQDPKTGDYQLNGALPLAKRLKQNPRDLAQKLADAMAAHEAVADASVGGPGFVNLRLDATWIAAQLEAALADRARDGIDAVDQPKTIVIDFSSPNIAKQMHVGHLRSTIIGDALVKLNRAVGHTVIGDNHLGDWGTQYGLLIAGMNRFGSLDSLSEDPIDELERIYKKASALAKEDEAFADEARAELAKLQRGDEANLALWKRFVEATRRSLETIYQRLDITFDEWLGESAYEAALPGVVERLLDEGIAREDQGAICIFFSEMGSAPEKLKKQESPFIVRKKDGAYLYSTTDIATVLHRKEAFSADVSIYVVDARQGRHFE